MQSRPTSVLQRVGALGLLLGLALALAVAPASPAGADSDDETTTTVTVPGGYALGEGYVIGGAKVTCPGKPDATWSAKQGAAFVESLIAEMTFGNPPLEDPPADAPVCLVESSGLFGTTTTPSIFSVNYAAKGDKVWVQQVGNNWFIAPARTKGAYEGTVDPTKPSVDLTPQAATTTEAQDPGKSGVSSDDSSGSNVVPIVLAIALVAAALMGAVVWRQRRSGAEGSATGEGSAPPDEADAAEVPADDQ